VIVHPYPITAVNVRPCDPLFVMDGTHERGSVRTMELVRKQTGKFHVHVGLAQYYGMPVK
jgi:hypothetical protein